MVAVAVIYAFLPAVALSAMPVVNGETQLALPKEQGGYADDPILGVVKNIDLGALQHPAEIYVGILAATILFIATNAGLIGVSRLTYSMGQHRQLPELLRTLHPKFRTPYIAIIVFGAIACVDDPAGPGRLPRHDLRVRGDALVHDRAPRGDHAARQASPTSSDHGAARRDVPFRGRDAARCSRSSAGSAPALAWIVVTVLNVRVLIVGLAVARARASSIYVLYRRNQGLSLTETRQDRHARSPSSSTRSSTSRCWSRSRTTSTRSEAVATAVQAGRAAPARHPRARDDHRAAELADRRARCRSRRRARPSRSTPRACAAAGA